MRITLDTEGNDLRPHADTIWCAVALEDCGTLHRFFPDGASDMHIDGMCDRLVINYNLEQLPSFLEGCTDICMHNGIEYDRWLIDKKMNYLIPFEKVTDTLILSLLTQNQRHQHSVESYGEQFGVHKQGHEDWSKFSSEMLFRCEKDVIIQERILQYLMTEAEK